MKFFKFNWLFASLATTVLLLTACDKTEIDEQLGDKGQHIIKFLKYGGAFGDGFDNANLSFDPTSSEEKLEINLDYSTNQVSNEDITVTVEYDPAALAAYNATAGNAQYQKLPDSAYSFPTTTVVIKAGQTVSESFFVTFYPDKIDGSVNYMLPLKITSITGAPADVTAGPSSGTTYLHFIGNPLAGFYNVVGARYNYTGAVAWAGPPAALPAGGAFVAVPSPKFAAPIDAYTIQLDFANLGALNYYYFITANSDYSEITVDFSEDLLAGSGNRRVYISGYVPPSPGVKPEFHIITHYNNSAALDGNDRIVDEYFRHQ